MLFIVRDNQNTYIAPAGLDPWTRIGSIEDLCLGEVQSISIDPTICDVQNVFTVHPDGSLIDIFVIGMDVQFCTSALVSKPAAPVVRIRTSCPSCHLCVVTDKVCIRALEPVSGRSEDGSCILVVSDTSVDDQWGLVLDGRSLKGR